MKAYVSSSYVFVDYVRRLVPVLTEAGIEVCSHWQDRIGLSPMEIAEEDRAELEESDTIIFLSMGTSTGGGMWTEWGMALEMGDGYRNIVIGDVDLKVHPFLAFADEMHEDVESFLDSLSVAA